MQRKTQYDNLIFSYSKQISFISTKCSMSDKLFSFACLSSLFGIRTYVGFCIYSNFLNKQNLPEQKYRKANEFF